MPNNQTTLSNQIYLSRDNIRAQIIEYMQYYLELENVDLLKSSFLSFMVDTLSTLTSNILFYSISTYKEFYMTKAQLPESIFNLAAFLGYNTKEAMYSTANVLMNFPFGFSDPDTTFQIPEKFKFYSGDIEFVTFYETSIKITGNSNVTVTVLQDGTKTYNLPVEIDTTSSEPSFTFALPVRQYKQVIQEFQIDEDIQLYQFVTVDVPLEGKVSTMTVEVRDPESVSWRLYTEFNSVFLMSLTDYGFVSRTTINGRRLTFGNGLIGIQPLGGSTVRVTTNITEGVDGNVIASSIKTGDRIYVTDSLGKTSLVNYNVTNPSPAINGQDEESIQEVRSNAISNLVALNRLVGDHDYKHAGAILKNSPIANNSLPVLKRSDVKCNEIQLFSVVKFGNTERLSAITGENVISERIVPTRNASYEVPIDVLHIPRDTIITIDSYDFYTLFDITVDLMNSSAYYKYIIHEIEIVPVLVTSYGLNYDIFCPKLTVSKIDNSAVFELFYQSSEEDYDLCTAEMKVLISSLIYPMINDSGNKKFIYTFDPYTIFPSGKVNVEFAIYSSNESPIATYTSEVTFSKSLDDFMMSNVVSDSTAATTIIYDIPVVEKEYYDSIVKKDFELSVLQSMMSSMDFNSYRMLTDFTNLKFTNTIGTMINMKYNPSTNNDCIDIGTLTPPINAEIGDRYIIGFTETGEWGNKYGKVAQCIATSGERWHYFEPITDNIIFVTNKNKKYIYNGNKWVLTEYQIPLEIEAEVFKETSYYGSDIELANLVKDTLLTEYSSRFGPNITLYKSEIIRTIQNIDGVSHCNLIKPESNIFFEYDLESLSVQELLEYGAEFVYFTEESISVRVYSA